MHGIANNRTGKDLAGSPLLSRLGRFLWAWRAFLITVVVPTLITITYFVFIAADQYESEAQFIVRQADGQKQSTLGFGGLGISGVASEDANSITEFLTSHEAVAWLRRNQDLVARFRRPEADLLSRLWPPDPTPEALHRFFQDQVTVEIDPDTNLIAMRVRAFRPADSHAIASSLLALGERRVNDLNTRIHNAALSLAQRQLDESELVLTNAQHALTVFRQRYNNIDPVATGSAQLEMVTKLKTALAQVRAQKASMARFVSASSPQLRAVDAQIGALSAEVNAAQATLSGRDNQAIAARVGDYQELQLKQALATKRYDIAVAQYERARTDLEKQQMYVVEVVDPNMPVKATYPKSLKIIATVFFCLLLAYGIGWLITAGVREHAA